MKLGLVLLFCFILISGALAEDDEIPHHKNPIISLFETPLKALRTRPGEAVAVFQPIKIQGRDENNTDSSSASWFPAELGTIGNAAQSLLPNWLSGRTTTTTTPKPEIIIQVHQNDNNRQHPILNIGPVNNNKNKNDDDDVNDDDDDDDDDQDDFLKDDENDDEDDEEEESNNQKKKKQKQRQKNKKTKAKRRRPLLGDEDDDDDDDDEFYEDKENYKPYRRRNNNNNKNHNRRRVSGNKFRLDDTLYDDRINNRIKNSLSSSSAPLADSMYLIDEDQFLDDLDFLHRTIDAENELDEPYYDLDDEDDVLDSIHHTDGRKLNSGNRRRQQPIRYQQNRGQMNRRKIVRNHPIRNQGGEKEHRDTIDEINIRMKLKNPQLQQKDTNAELNQQIRRELMMEEKLRLQRQRQQQIRRRNQQQNRPGNEPDRLAMNDFLKPFQDIPDLARPIRYGTNVRRKPIGVLQQEERERRRKQQNKNKGNSDDPVNFEIGYDSNDKNQRPFQQSQHILIPIHVMPQSVPYKDVVPQVQGGTQHIQVVAQHHHTVEHSEESQKPMKPQNNKNKKKPQPMTDHDYEDDDSYEDEEDDDEDTFKINKKQQQHRPVQNKNKKQGNRPKPTMSRHATVTKKQFSTTKEPIKPMKDSDRPDAPMSSSSEEMTEDTKKETYSNGPPLPQGFSDDDSKESKSAEGRAQYYLPQRYFQILGTDKYLAVGGKGRFLLKTGRNLDMEKNGNENTAMNDTKPIEDKEKKVPEILTIEHKTPSIISTSEIESTKEEPLKEPEPQLTTTTEKPPLTTTTEKQIPVSVVKIDEPHTKNSEKVLVKSEIVQEKQNGHFVVRSEPIDHFFGS